MEKSTTVGMGVRFSAAVSRRLTRRSSSRLELIVFLADTQSVRNAATNHGEMSFQELAKLNKPRVIVLYSDPRIAKHLSIVGAGSNV